MAEIRVRRSNWRKWAEFAGTWERIHRVSPGASIFLAPEWVDSWLATFGDEVSAELVAFDSGAETVGCCLLAFRTKWTAGIPLRQIYLNCAGEDEADSTFIEFNSLLCLPEWQEAVARSLVEHLKRRRWDELLLPGIIDQQAVGVLADSFGEGESRETQSHCVDFGEIRRSGEGYIQALSAKRRKHIRRSQRVFEEMGGACVVEVARTAAEALEMLGQLAELHQARWETRGEAGCFNSVKFVAFHRRFIERNMDRVMLCRLQAGSELVGVLYCFVYNGWVYHYQCGFRYTLDSRMSPGLLTLYQVIELCLAREELAGFDFMAGETEYKRALACSSSPRRIRWMTIRRRTLRNALFLLLRRLKRRYGPAANTRQPVEPAEESLVTDAR